MFSVFRNTTLAAIVAGLGLLDAGGAKASLITYDFTVTADSDLSGGPLAGTVAHGTLSYDSSTIMPGMTNAAPGLLTSLRFSWNGVAYSKATANTGSLAFDASGNLTFILFGSDCNAEGCFGTPGANEFDAVVAVGYGGVFQYTVPSDAVNFFMGGVTAALAVPEPASLMLLAVGLAGLGVALRWRA